MPSRLVSRRSRIATSSRQSMPSILKTDSAWISQTVHCWTRGIFPLPSPLFPLPSSLLRHLRQRLFQFVVVGLVPRIVQNLAITDHSTFIYDEHSTLRDVFQPDHVGIDDTIRLNRLFVVVAE